MQTVSTIKEVRGVIAGWRDGGERVAFVPTMGNLHEGHLALVRRAAQLAGRVVVSIFVNPLQFGPSEDFNAYPRTPEEDGRKLRDAGLDLLFMPPEGEIYPRGQPLTRVEVQGLSSILCGAFRPGHFAGVATVVAKLLNIVQPDLALFGEKDYQQLVVIRRMVADLCMPVEIVGVATVREPDGLALSSRNQYLTPEERRRAPVVYRSLCMAGEALRRGGRDCASIETEGTQMLSAAGLRPEYFSVRRAADLEPPGAGDRELVILAAAWLGRARLIDNLPLSI